MASLLEFAHSEEPRRTIAAFDAARDALGDFLDRPDTRSLRAVRRALAHYAAEQRPPQVGGAVADLSDQLDAALEAFSRARVGSAEMIDRAHALRRALLSHHAAVTRARSDRRPELR